MYHRCTHGNDGPSFTRLCPLGTLYNQQYFVCDWFVLIILGILKLIFRWFNVDCSTVTEFYAINDDNYAESLEAAGR